MVAAVASAGLGYVAKRLVKTVMVDLVLAADTADMVVEMPRAAAGLVPLLS